MSIKVVIADDHTITLEGLRTLLQQVPDIKVVGEAHNGREAMSLVEKLRPDVVLMDVRMPDLNGMDATRQILAQHPQIKIIALTMFSDKRYVTSMISAGASGYLLKEDCTSEELIRAIHTVVQGRKHISSGITDVLMDHCKLHVTDAEKPGQGTLTDREREVLQRLAVGETTARIATDLHLSIKTIETYRQHIMDKLQIDNIAGLTKYAIRTGLSTLERTVLTEREREILQLIAEGKTTSEISHLLNISDKTIFTYRQRMMRKLRIDNVADLTRYAITAGLTTLEE